jgi:NADH-quinone oxidoreductase subunit L
MVLVKLYYFDDVIDWLFVRPAQALGRFFGSIFDPEIIDGTVRGIVSLNRSVADGLRGMQDGLLRSYALIVVFGAAIFAIYYALQGAVR